MTRGMSQDFLRKLVHGAVIVGLALLVTWLFIKTGVFRNFCRARAAGR